ncbi:hypothetical protein EST38_g7467 [Candolleomyces aberdarensis]|uniref:LysM domain-containing protein n=1 Tax=Candolleomyces aberdarensis TaxID=2316362 RepID=A0A4Q2DF28_9AGAR|nr:hypothetical protein EST38_g7467 [Candolleomyces aberdarensis]
MLFTAGRFASLVAVAMTLTSGTLAQVPPCVRNYTVQAGDWCDKISAEQNASTYQLLAANQGNINPECTNLRVGQVICLGRQGQDCTNVVVVQSGNSCESIAAAAGISYAALRANNPNVDENCTNIYPGEVLCVQGGSA